MSALVDAIATVVHQWFVEMDDACPGHQPPEHHLYPDCRQLADRIVSQLDWPDVDR